MDNFVVEKDLENDILIDDFNQDFPNFEDQNLPFTKKERKNNINPKTIALSLVVLTVVVLFFSVNQWFDSLKIPFAERGDITELNANFSVADSGVANLLELQQKDTDLDGLSDYEELYVYKTSPYLADSDSDGYIDYDEIKNNQDPNCPAGQDCGTNLEAQTVTPELLGLDNEPEGLDLTPAEIRLLLIQGGISQEEVNAIDDESLIQFYSEALESMQAAGPEIIEGQQLENFQIDDLSNLISAEQLRAILIQQGIDKETLDALPDDELIQMFEELMADE